MGFSLEILLLAMITCCSLLVFFISFSSPKHFPLLKMLPAVFLKSRNLYNKITQVLAENKGTVLLKTSWLAANTDTLVTADPANVHHVLNTHYSIYQRGSEFRKVFGFLGDAVFIKDLDEWRQGKKFTHSFYKETQFHNSTPKILRHTLEKGLVPVLDHASHHNQPVDLQTLFHRYMLDATCILATGFDPGSLRVGFPKSPLLDSMDDISEAVYSRLILPESVWKVQRWLGVGKEKKFADAVCVLYQTLHEYVLRKYDDYQESEEGFDVLKYYIANNNQKSTEYLAFNLMTLLFAGRDTSAALLTWFFHLVSTNPSVEENILQEIRHESNSFLNPRLFYEAEELSKLVYLQGALTESLRLFPTAPVIIRDPTQEDMLPSGHRVNTKTKVVLCTYAMGRMGEIWSEDWAEFKPERWLSEKGELKRVASNSFLAFGSGPWACPGKEVAMTRMKGVVATIMHNYRVDVWEGQSISPGASTIMTMRHGLKATISNRWV